MSPPAQVLKTERLVLLPVVFKMILIAHIRSLFNACLFGTSNAHCIFYMTI